VTDEVNGWVKSADAWITSMGEAGDWSRRTFLDAIMIARATAIGGSFLDIGCGEGRFVRLLTDRGMQGTGVDPVERLVNEAVKRDIKGDYRVGIGEKLEFPDDRFDLTVSYLALIDIEDFRSAIKEMVRVTKPGGAILIANLTSYFTAGKWVRDASGAAVRFELDHYDEERPTREKWSGIDIINWHRPLEAYLDAFLSQGLILRHFSEPRPEDKRDHKHDRYSRVPGFVVMEWQKPS